MNKYAVLFNSIYFIFVIIFIIVQKQMKNLVHMKWNER